MPRPPVHLFQSASMTVQRNTVTVGSAGGPSHSWANHLTSVECLIQPMSMSESVRYGRESTRRLFRVSCEGGQDIQGKDRVTITHNVGGVSTTRTMDVIETKDQQSREQLMVLICEETLG